MCLLCFVLLPSSCLNQNCEFNNQTTYPDAKTNYDALPQLLPSNATLDSLGWIQRNLANDSTKLYYGILPFEGKDHLTKLQTLVESINTRKQGHTQPQPKTLPNPSTERPQQEDLGPKMGGEGDTNTQSQLNTVGPHVRSLHNVAEEDMAAASMSVLTPQELVDMVAEPIMTARVRLWSDIPNFNRRRPLAINMRNLVRLKSVGDFAKRMSSVRGTCVVCVHS